MKLFNHHKIGDLVKFNASESLPFIDGTKTYVVVEKEMREEICWFKIHEVNSEDLDVKGLNVMACFLDRV